MEGRAWDSAPFISWLHAHLRRREWTAADLARRMGMPSGTISRWLSGERRPSPQSCDLLADVLGAELDEVLTLAGHRPSASPLPPDDPKRRIIALVKRVHMSPEMASGLEAMLTAWLAREPATAHGEGR